MRPVHKSSLPVALATFPLYWIVSTFIFAQAAFVIGLPLRPVVGALGWIAAVLIVHWNGENLRNDLVAAVVSLAAWVGLSVIGTAVHDCSWDGQSYHQDAIMYLAQGWNPWARDLTNAETAQYFWISSFPKAAWISEAITFQLFGHLEAAKSVAWIIGLSFSGVAAMVTHQLPGPKLARWSLYALLLLNPVAIGECWTLMMDHCVVWAFGGAMISAAMLFYPAISPWSPKVSLATLMAWLLLLATLKLTGIVYAGYTLIAMALFWAVRRRQAGLKLLPDLPTLTAKRTGLLIFGIVILFLSFGNPYGQNYLKHGHPLWPALGPGKKDIMVTQEHPAFVDAIGPVKFFWSMNSYSRTHVFNSPAVDSQFGLPVVKAPFAVRKSEILSFVSPDVHCGGYGPWYGGVVWAGALLLVLGWMRKWPGVRELTYLWFFVLGLILINPQSWLVRYAPYGWWLALVPLGLTLTVQNRNVRLAGYILIALLGLNVTAILLVNTAGEVICERDVRRQMKILAQSSSPRRIVIGTCSGNRERFTEANIPLDTLMNNRLGGVNRANAPLYSVRLTRTDTVVETDDKAFADRLRAAGPVRP